MFQYMKSNIPLALIALHTFFAPAVDASPYVISDDRVRSLDITPVLGRGYSIMTNTYQSTCLDVQETTVPSYNYDYTFYDFTASTDVSTDMSSKLSYSFGYWWLNGNLDISSDQNTNTETQKRVIVSTMRIERYYASIREETSPMNAPAMELLTRQDYVGFFKACGPTFIRGIRRAQEVTASFEFESSSTETASSFAYNLQVSSGWWYWGRFNYENSFASSNTFNSITSSLKISIVGYGLGLTQEGSETLVATALMDYIEIMKFAFNSMTKNKDSVHIGMVYGMEVTPWAEHIQFQILSGVQEEAIEVPLARSLIPRAYSRTDPTDFEYQSYDRALFRCKAPEHFIDKYGYCCEDFALYDYATQEYDSEDPETKVCRPMRPLDRTILTDNMAANGEFVARLDRLMRLKTAQLSTMEKCISAITAIPDRYNYHILQPQGTVMYDSSIDTDFTVFEMKMALDPFGDYAVLSHMTKELDEWIEMFYAPCISALFGSNIGLLSDTDPNYFMAYPWYNHPECSHLSCFGNSMRWNRGPEGGCVPSLMAGPTDSAGYSDSETNCKKATATDTSSYTESCEYSSNELAEFHARVTSGWTETIPVGRIDYYIDHFCMPKLTNTEASNDKITALKLGSNTILGNNSMNVAQNKPTSQSTTDYSGIPSRGVDGNINPRWRYKSITHTALETNPWFKIDLQNTETIQTVKVYNRQDCCTERLNNFRMTILKDGAEVFTHNDTANPPPHETVIEVDPPVEGDEVMISLPGRTDYLSLAEVEVWNIY